MSTIPSNLNWILLNACGAAYNVAPNTCTYTPDTTYSPNVPYAQNPGVACGGQDDIDVVTVGQVNFASGESGIVVACRGTLPPSLNDPASLYDWIQDFFAEPTTSTSGPYQVPGQVHSGFFDATTAVADQVVSLVKSFNPGPNNPVYVTGHSKGGGVASILAYILSQNMGIPNVQPLVTFASAKPGDTTFQAGFQSVLSQTRFENYDDIVPLLPPSTSFISLVVSVLKLIPYVGQELAELFERAENWNYVPVGSQEFITSNFQVVPNYSVEIQTLDVVWELGSDLYNENFSSFAAAHSLAPGGGYNTALAPAQANAVVANG
jgi:Lipase (class 3)